MGAAFDRWLARPSTLHFLRQLIGPHDEHATSRFAYHLTTVRNPHRSRAYASAVAVPSRLHDEDESEVNQHVVPRRTAGRSAILEQGLRMSLSSEVNLLQSMKTARNTKYDKAFEALRIQADVDSNERFGELLVDQPEHRHNMRLWIELLQFRLRLDGYKGVCEVWRGMRRRSVDLPTEGDEADVLWTIFANAGTWNEVSTQRSVEGQYGSLVQDLCLYAEDLRNRTNARYSKLYKAVMTCMLQTDGTKVQSRHHWFSKTGLLPPDGIKQVMGDVIMRNMNGDAMQALKSIYLASNDRDIYDTCISELLKSDNETSALWWHRLLMKCGDGPSQAMFARSEVQHLFNLDHNKSLPMKHLARLRTPQLSTAKNEDAKYPALTRASMSGLLGDVHGIKPKEISDSFVAKMFATRAFSLDLVIRGLSFFGVDTLGPLALRELAIRARSPVPFCNKLNDLRSMNITISNAIYCQLLQVLGSENDTDLFRQVLESDQHPEAYDDLQTQEALLVSFLEHDQWKQAYITIICLSLGGAHLQSRAWNRALQHYLQTRQWHQVAQIMHTLRSQRVPLTQKTITWLHSYMLPARRASKLPVESQRTDGPEFSALEFVTGTYMYSDELSRHVHFKLWRELLKRYGMSFQWDGLEKLILWLAKRYSSRRFRKSNWLDSSEKRSRMRRRSVLLRTSPAHSIFDAAMQQAIVHWGLKSAAARHQLQPETATRQPTELSQLADFGSSTCAYWAQGIALLARLMREFDIPIQTSQVRQAFKLRMLGLFGPAHSRLWFNERMRENNRLSLAHYIRHANQVWGGSGDDRLINIDDALLEPGSEEDPGARMEIMIALFGRDVVRCRRRNADKQEYMDIPAWSASHTAATQYWTGLYRGRTMTDRKRIWRHSPFRFVSSRSLH